MLPGSPLQAGTATLDSVHLRLTHPLGMQAQGTFSNAAFAHLVGPPLSEQCAQCCCQGSITQPFCSTWLAHTHAHTHTLDAELLQPIWREEGVQGCRE
jgi:hypothetical protein